MSTIMLGKQTIYLMGALLLTSCGAGLVSEDAEATSTAQTVFDSIFVRCGEFTYAKSSHFLSRFKDAEINAMSMPLSEADGLNDVEWRGMVTYAAGPFQIMTDSGWSEFKDNIRDSEASFIVALGQSVFLEKRKGEWTFGSLELGEYERLDCSLLEDITR